MKNSYSKYQFESIVFSIVYVLSKVDFEEIHVKFPEIQKALKLSNCLNNLEFSEREIIINRLH